MQIIFGLLSKAHALSALRHEKRRGVRRLPMPSGHGVRTVDVGRHGEVGTPLRGGAAADGPVSVAPD